MGCGKIFRRVDSDEDREALQRDLDRLVRWSEVWQMKFNVDKCKVMHMGRGNLGGSYVMNGGTLGVVSEERDLEAGEGAAQVYKDGAGDEGLGL